MNNMEDAARYNSIKIRLRLIGFGFIVVFLAFFQVFFSPALKVFALSLTPNLHYALGIYLVFFGFFYYLVNFPLHFYSAFVVEHKFGLSDQRFYAWVKDDIKGASLSSFIFFLFIQALYALLKYCASTWWIWMAFFWFVTTVLIARVTPTFILPLFFKYSAVGASLSGKIIGLSKRCRIKIMDVRKIDFSKKTKKLNAAVIGLGKTRRVILADNLVNDFSDEEVLGVMAHEFGHHKLLHMWKLIIFGLFTALFSFFVLYLASSGIVGAYLQYIPGRGVSQYAPSRGAVQYTPRRGVLQYAPTIYDIEILPAILLVLFITGFLTMPASNAFSRRLERRADRFALEVTGDKGSFVSLMKKLAERNLADPNPPKLVKFLFYDHPPISERISQAESFR